MGQALLRQLRRAYQPADTQRISFLNPEGRSWRSVSSTYQWASWRWRRRITARTEAQSGVQFVGISVSVQGTTTNTLAIAGNGDVYGRSGGPQCAGSTMIWNNSNCDWQLMGNVLTGPVPVESQSFGAVKGMFR